MSKQSVKLELIEWVAQIKDEGMLQNLLSFKHSVTEDDWYNQLNASQLASIEAGINDHTKGEVLTSKEFWSKHSN